MATDESNYAIAVDSLDRLGRPNVHLQRWRRGMDHDEVIWLGLSHGLLGRVTMWRGIEQASSGHQTGRVSQPGGIPEGPDLARRLVARTRTPVEVVVGRRVQEHGFHRVHWQQLRRLSERLVQLYKPPPAGSRKGLTEDAASGNSGRARTTAGRVLIFSWTSVSSQ